MRAILVSVDYADLLAITLPYNRHHFEEVMVVTTPTDTSTIKVALENQCRVCETNAFYEDGANFNKWRALEYGLDLYGRRGLMCIMDADILWPKVVQHWLKRGALVYEPGYLYTPERYCLEDIRKPVPPESEWKMLPQLNDSEWAGYTQIFFANDRHLPKPPWHDINWRHAGGADSFFARCWPRKRWRRPTFKALHLGVTGANWCGRATATVAGAVPPEAQQRREALHGFMKARTGNSPTTRFQAEKLPAGLPGDQAKD